MVHALLDFGLPPKASSLVHPTYVHMLDVVLDEILQETQPTYSALILIPKFLFKSVPIKRYGCIEGTEKGDILVEFEVLVKLTALDS